MQIDLADGDVSHPIIRCANINTSLVSVHFLNYVRRGHVLILACAPCCCGPSVCGYSTGMPRRRSRKRDRHGQRMVVSQQTSPSSLLHIPAAAVWTSGRAGPIMLRININILWVIVAPWFCGAKATGCATRLSYQSRQIKIRYFNKAQS